MTALPCLECGDDYERPRARMSHYCPQCRDGKNRERNAQRKREVRAATQAVRDRVDEYVGLGMDSAYAERYHDHLDELLGELRGGLALLPRDAGRDRMPPGSFTPAGSNDGTSTYFGDLADELDAHAAEVAAHPWFAANPHWCFDLHGDDVDLSKLKAS